MSARAPARPARRKGKAAAAPAPQCPARYASLATLAWHLKNEGFEAEQCGTDDPKGPRGALYVNDHCGRPGRITKKTIVSLIAGEVKEPAHTFSPALRDALGLPIEPPVEARVQHVRSALVQLDVELLGAARASASLLFDEAARIDDVNADRHEADERPKRRRNESEATYEGRVAMWRAFVARLRERSFVHAQIAALLAVENHKDC